MVRPDFSEVGHTGGKVTFDVRADADGRLSYSIEYSSSSPRPATLVGVYALPGGIVCGNIKMGGIGQPWNPPPSPECIAVLMASDSEGRFGHQCPECTEHFRTANIPASFPLTCPYCGLRAASFHFLTPPQLAYVRHYLATLHTALDVLEAGKTAEVKIDMDEIADAVTDAPKPEFYYASIAQQTQFRCSKCGNFNDVRGRYVYCASCGWRNNAALLKDTMSELRNRLNDGEVSPEDAVKQAVSAFDACSRSFVDQLVTRSPMKASRCAKVQGLLFHNLDRVEEALRTVFDIDLTAGLGKNRAFVRKMFFRRHVYEHDGGVATARYVRESGDTAVEEGVLLRETVENVHDLIGALIRMTETVETDFHEIFPPEPFCIELERERRNRQKRSSE